MYIEFLLLIGCQFLTQTTAELVSCHVLESDNRNLPASEYGSSIRVDYCDPETQKCCVSGCCRKENDAAMIAFIVLFLGAGISMVICKRCCFRPCYEAAEARSIGINANMDNAENETLAPRSDRNDPQVHVVLPPVQPSAPVENPVTPPPAYEVAIVMPSAPVSPQSVASLEPQNRIPSYEDVMTGRMK